MGNWMKLAGFESGRTLRKQENKQFDLSSYWTVTQSTLTVEIQTALAINGTVTIENQALAVILEQNSYLSIK